MEIWLVWITSGIAMALLELIVPGGIIVFLGLAAIVVGGAINLGWIETTPMAFLTWFITSILFMIFLRSIFVKYFEGDSKVQNTNEDVDQIGTLVEVLEEIQPYKPGRVRYRDSTWSARSDEELQVGSKVIISYRDGNSLVVKSL